LSRRGRRRQPMGKQVRKKTRRASASGEPVKASARVRRTPADTVDAVLPRRRVEIRRGFRWNDYKPLARRLLLAVCIGITVLQLWDQMGAYLDDPRKFGGTRWK